MYKNNHRQVLVTGGTGFLGSHCVLQLLNQGFKVRTSLRNLNKKEGVLAMLQNQGARSLENLSFVEADLAKDDHWDKAAEGCDYILHVASPFPFKMPKDESELIKPAVNGTLRVLKAASKTEVRRVVLTSSFAAVGYSHKDFSKPITEEDWTNPQDKNLSAYTKSKTLAEKVAWEYIQNVDSTLELAVICPRYILGPSLGTNLTTSLTAMKQLFDGTMKATPNISYGIVDVRDVADLHIRAMTDENAKNQRFLASSGPEMSFHEIALFLKEKLGEQAKKVTTRVYPNWLIRLVALFNPAAKGIAPHLGKTLVSNNHKATRLLGWQPRSNQEAILASIDSILAVDKV
ncbi:aldehyde reductase [marine bacterium AO1-C]|nr:aldehyde reductase [marine bacterium AO1-C]